MDTTMIRVAVTARERLREIGREIGGAAPGRVLNLILSAGIDIEKLRDESMRLHERQIGRADDA